MRRKLRSVLKSGKYIFASFLILLITILSAFSVSASTVYSNQAVTDSIIGVPYTLEMIYNTGDNWDSMLYSYSPIFYDRGSNPNTYHSLVSDRSSFDSANNAIGVSADYYYEDPTRFQFSQYSYPLQLNHLTYDNTGHFVGSAIVDNYIDFYKSSNLNTPSGELSLKAQDFSCWTDLDGVAGTEIFFDFRNMDPKFSFGNVKVSYSVYGQGDTVYTMTFPYQNFVENNILVVTPFSLGYLDYGTYIYIHDLEVQIFMDFAFGYLFSGTYPLRFNTVYTFNPYLYDVSFGVGGDPGSFNPAVPLLDYTEFIGNAISGVLDLELFPSFTLGGIFMTVLAFVCVVWFLKLVAGG